MRTTQQNSRKRTLALAGLYALCALGTGLTIGHILAQTVPPQSSVYFSYPPGLIPSDLQGQSTRVLNEGEKIEAEAMSDWQALPKSQGQR